MILQNGSIAVKAKFLLSTSGVQPGVDFRICPIFLKSFPLTRRIKDKTIWAAMLLAFAPSYVVTLDTVQVSPGSISAYMEEQQGVAVG